MKNETNDERLKTTLLELDSESHEFKRKTFHNFIIQSLKDLSKTSEIMQDLLIGLYSPDPMTFAFLDLKKWYHRREYNRILSDNNDQHTLKQFEFVEQREKMHCLLLRCLEQRKLFYLELKKR